MSKFYENINILGGTFSIGTLTASVGSIHHIEGNSYVSGGITASSIQLTSGPSVNSMLISDATGRGSWTSSTTASRVGLSIRDSSNIEQFKVDDYIQYDGFIIDSLNKRIKNGITILDNANLIKTLALSDVNTRTIFSNNNNITLTIPIESSVPFIIGDKIEFTQSGTGRISLSYVGVTLNSNIGITSEQGGTYILTKIGSDVWTFEGYIDEGVRQPYTIYVDTTGVIGSDLTGMIENKSRPFQTFAAALSQIDNNNLWEFIFIDTGNINRNISGDMSNKKIKITCYNTGNSWFTFTGTSSVNQAIYLEIYTPNTNVIIAGTSYSVGASTLILNCKDLSFSGTNGTAGKLFSISNAGFYSNVTCNSITVTASQVYPLWLARLTLNVNILNITSTTLMGGHGGSQQIYEFYAKSIVVSGTCTLFGSHIYINCIIQNVSGTGSLYILHTNANTLDILFMQGVIVSTVNVYLIYNVNGTTLSNCNVKVSGVYSDKYVTNPLLISRRVGSNQGTTCLITLKNFTGAISTDIIDSYNVTFINSNIFVNTFLATIPVGGYNILGMRFLGTNVIHQQTPGALIDKTNTPLIADVLQNFGVIRTNATSLGINVTINDNTPNSY